MAPSELPGSCALKFKTLRLFHFHHQDDEIAKASSPSTERGQGSSSDGDGDFLRLCFVLIESFSFLMSSSSFLCGCTEPLIQLSVP